MECQTCHNIHQKAGEDLLAIDNKPADATSPTSGLCEDRPARIARPEDVVAALPVGSYGLAGAAAPLMRAAFAAVGREKEIAFSDDRPPVPANFAKTLVAHGVAHWQRRNDSDGMPRPLYLREADVTLPKPFAR